jgi:Cyclic nucleotide-binding domain
MKSRRVALGEKPGDRVTVPRTEELRLTNSRSQPDYFTPRSRATSKPASACLRSGIPAMAATVDQGLLKVMVASPRGEERIIAILGSGAILGELSMIDGLPRSASVAALRTACFDLSAGRALCNARM